MEMARRLQAMNVPKYKGLTRRSGKRTVWNGVVREDKAALDIPLRWNRPRKIFVNSMSDLFHDRVTDAFIVRVWAVMRATPHHHYQILTKRPERMGALFAPRSVKFRRTYGLVRASRTPMWRVSISSLSA